MPTSFSINWDYRCPFARNANEHVITALRSGEPLDVRFTAFSQSQSAVEEGGTAVWDDPDKRDELIAVAAGIVVRDQFPEQFYDAHLSLFAMRHDDGEDIRDEAIVRRALERVGVDADAVMKELDEGWPFEVFRSEHERSVDEQQVFGVPTFIAGAEVVFVRLMTRPGGDAKLAKATVKQVLDLLVHHPEINEYKHTTVPF
jgi:predicted DsbA family dithiol-disulfide isomerase